MPLKLGIIAGGGPLPRRIAEHCRTTGREYFIVALKSYADRTELDGLAYEWFRIGAAGKIIKTLRNQNVKSIVMVGSVIRPSILTIFPDWYGIKFLFSSGRKAIAGDNSLLSSITKQFEDEGFRVFGIDHLLIELLAPVGQFGKIMPTKKELQYIEKGVIFAKKLGKRDIGQAVVMVEETMIAAEDQNGTDDLIRRCSSIVGNSHKAILVKTIKPNQERRVDLPTIGVDTVKLAAECGFSGIAIEAGKSIVVDIEKVIAAADEEGLFVTGIRVDSENQFSKTDIKKLKLVVIAGEASGDKIGGKLMAALKELSDRDIDFYGVGGASMVKQGFTQFFPMSDLSYMGISEIIPQLPNLLTRIKKTVNNIENIEPHAVITIDVPDFSLRVAKKLHRNNAALIHYVAPSVWAWKKWRARKMSKYLDLLITLFHFEPEYFLPWGLECKFVGHPVIESTIHEGDGLQFRNQNHLNENDHLICLLPGSRKNEVEKHLPIMRETLALVQQQGVNFKCVIPLSENISELVENSIKAWPFELTLTRTDKEKYDAFAASNVALAASGTVSLELAISLVPYITIYQMSWVSNFIAKAMVKVKYVNLINILLDKPAVPELLMDKCKASLIAPHMIKALTDQKFIDTQREDFVSAIRLIGSQKLPPSKRAALEILDKIK